MILYHLTAPPAPLPRCDAIEQEVETLRAEFGGQLVYIYPGRRPGTRIPRRWWGLHLLPAIRRAERHAAIHHIYNPDPFPFPLLRLLRRPIVYTVAAGLKESDRPAAQRLARLVHTIVVTTPADLDLLRRWGAGNAALIRPGIHADRFPPLPPPPPGPFRLLAGSAPWTVSQFQSKGIDGLLALAREVEDLHLILLWRGLLAGEMARRIDEAGLEGRVTLLNERVEVHQVLARAHAAVALAAGTGLIKAYPHSLLEALAAGRPVLLSRSIPMSAYVEEQGCGVVVEGVDPASLREGLSRLREGYEGYRRQALAVGVDGMTAERMVAGYRRLYQEIKSRRDDGLVPDR